jgi:hypothetical protein
VGRATVIVGGTVGVAAFIYVLLQRHEDAYAALTRALVATGLTMVVLGVADRFWRGAKVKKAGLDGTGPSVEFQDHIARAVDEMNERMSDHVSTINDRLYDIEKALFKNGDNRTTAQE